MDNDNEISRLLGECKRSASDIYVAIVALICSCLDFPGKEFVDTYSRGCYKRAIKHLRVMQKQIPNAVDFYEQGIKHIRKYWLERESITPPQVLTYILPGIWQALSPAHIRKDGKI